MTDQHAASVPGLDRSRLLFSFFIALNTGPRRPYPRYPPPQHSLQVPGRACSSRSGPIHPEAGLSIPKRAYLSRNGPIYPETGLSIPKRAYLSRSGPIHPEAGLSIPRRVFQSQGGSIYPKTGSGPVYPEAGLSHAPSLGALRPASAGARHS